MRQLAVQANGMYAGMHVLCELESYILRTYT